MPLSKEDFSKCSFFELICNITLCFEYLEYMDSENVSNYLKWNIEFAHKIWLKTFPNFNFVMMKMKKQSSFFMPGVVVDEESYITKLEAFERRKKRRYFN